MAGLLQRLADIVRAPNPESKPFEGNCSTVEIAGHGVIKTYTGPDKADRVIHLQYTVYHLLKEHVDSLVHRDKATIVLSPRGIAKPPETEKELLTDLKQVLLREPPIFHRDIRWPNIMRRLDNPERWFIIDWEDAAVPPTRVPPHFTPRTHSPQDFKDGHGAEVDMRGVGELIFQCRALHISPGLRDLGKWMQGLPAPSASEALAKIREYQLSHQ